MKLFTIGFTKTTAERFFSRLTKSGARKVVDVRLNNVSQLAGFAKRDDLKYFVHELCGMQYEHMPLLAPSRDMLDAYKKDGCSWDQYADRFNALMANRQIENLDRPSLDSSCFLCSEDKPHHCHRRLVAEYLRAQWGDLDIVHL